mgnify:CR=1 FL=1
MSETARGIAGLFIFKYADSITESLISCASLVLASLISLMILNREMTISFYLAIGNLCIATLLYEASPTQKKKKQEEIQRQESIEIEDYSFC